MLEWCNFSQPSPQMMAVFCYIYAKKILFLYINTYYINMTNDRRNLKRNTEEYKSILDKCNDDCKQFLQVIITQLESDYKQVPQEFLPMLILIRDWYNVYLEARDDMAKYGILSRDERNRLAKSRSFSVMNIAYNNVLRILNQFAVSPLNKARMMSLNKNQQNSDTQAYIDSILNG